MQHVPRGRVQCVRRGQNFIFQIERYCYFLTQVTDTLTLTRIEGVIGAVTTKIADMHAEPEKS